MTKMTKNVIAALVVGIAFSITLASTAQAAPEPNRSSCSSVNVDPAYVGPCSVMLPVLLEFTASSPVFDRAVWYNDSGTISGDAPLAQQTTAPDANGRYRFWVSVMYVPLSRFNISAIIGGSRVGADVVVLGNAITEPFSNFLDPVPIEAKRLKGKKCRVSTTLSLFALQDFRYQIGLKLKGGLKKIRRKARKVVDSVQRLFEPPRTKYQQWTYGLSLKLKKHQVKALARHRYKLVVWQKVSALGAKPTRSTKRVIRFKKKFCKSWAGVSR